MKTIEIDGVVWEVAYEIGGGYFVVCVPSDPFPKPTYVVRQS